MKRPLLLCAAVFLLISIWCLPGRMRQNEQRMAASENMIESCMDKNGSVHICGTVKDCERLPEGTRILLGQMEVERAEGKAGSSAVLLDQGQKVLFQVKKDEDGRAERTDPKTKEMDGRKEDEEKEKETEKKGKKKGVDEALLPGDRITLTGTVETFEYAGNPGQFDERSYYQRQKVICRITNADYTVLQRGRGLRHALYRLRAVLRNSLMENFGEEEGATIAAIGLGEKSGMSRDIKARYQEGGTAHITSVSGMHVDLIAMSVYRLLRIATCGIGGAAAGSLFVLFLYVVLTGSGVSAVRAFLMFGIWLGAQVTGRKYDRKISVAAAAVIILISDVEYLRDASFLLSFDAAGTIAYLLPLIQDGIAAKGKTARIDRAAVFGIGLWIGMLPIALFFFYQTPVWSIFVNVLVVPLIPAVMGFGLAASLAGLLPGQFGVFLAAPAHYLLSLIDGLCAVELQLPGALWIAGRPKTAAILLYYGILIMAGWMCSGLGKRENQDIRNKHNTELRRQRRHRRNLKKPAVWGAALMLCLLLMRGSGPGNLEIYCLDVGQGDGALLRMPDGTVCMVDGGSSSEKAVWKYRISQTLKYCGIDTLDYVFLSHADGDHISGIEEFLSEYECGGFGGNIHGITVKQLVLPPTADPEDFSKIRRLASEKGIQICRMEAGAFVASGGDGVLPDAVDGEKTGILQRNEGNDWRIECLSPKKEQLFGEQNQDSMVLMLRYGNFRMLFTGDLEKEAELALAEQAKVDGGSPLRADVLKVGHHGSRFASSKAFLREVQPKASVISCALKNRYHHPAAETVERLQEAGSRIYSTAGDGAVKIETDGETFQIHLSRRDPHLLKWGIAN